MSEAALKYKAKDFTSDQEVRWCPGCGDYAILKQVQSAVAEIGVPKEDIVFISGIGCSSRFPYYMDTYGMHSIHGRATAIASGLKVARPELSVWIITGDGDSLSIGGNHLMHLLRRNINSNILLFNNEIYGLTKGQYSPTSVVGQHTKSSPTGVIDYPINPPALAIGAGATFVARAIDREPRHLKNAVLLAEKHHGTSFVEIYQNCPVFNDGAFTAYTERGLKEAKTLFLEEGEPLIFDGGSKGIVIDNMVPKVVEVNDTTDKDALWIHDSSNKTKAFLLSQFIDNDQHGEFPKPFGVFYQEQRSTYEDELTAKLEKAQANGEADLDALIAGNNTWLVY